MSFRKNTNSSFIDMLHGKPSGRSSGKTYSVSSARINRNSTSSIGDFSMRRTNSSSNSRGLPPARTDHSFGSGWRAEALDQSVSNGLGIQEERVQVSNSMAHTRRNEVRSASTNFKVFAPSMRQHRGMDNPIRQQQRLPPSRTDHSFGSGWRAEALDQSVYNETGIQEERLHVSNSGGNACSTEVESASTDFQVFPPSMHQQGEMVHPIRQRDFYGTNNHPNRQHRGNSNSSRGRQHSNGMNRQTYGNVPLNHSLMERSFTGMEFVEYAENNQLDKSYSFYDAAAAAPRRGCLKNANNPTDALDYVPVFANLQTKTNEKPRGNSGAGRDGGHSNVSSDTSRQRYSNQDWANAHPAFKDSNQASSSTSYAPQFSSKDIQGTNQFIGNEAGENKSVDRQKQDARRASNGVGRGGSHSNLSAGKSRQSYSNQPRDNAYPALNESIQASSPSFYALQNASKNIPGKNQFIGNEASEKNSDVRQKQDVRRSPNRAGRGVSHLTVNTDARQQRLSNQNWTNTQPAINDSIQESSSTSYAAQSASKDTQGKNESVGYETCENKSLDRQKQDARRASNSAGRGGSHLTALRDARQQRFINQLRENAYPAFDDSIQASSPSFYAPKGASKDIQGKNQFVGTEASENNSDVRQKQDAGKTSNQAGRGGRHSIAFTDSRQQRFSNQPWDNACPVSNESIQTSSSSSYAPQCSSMEIQEQNQFVGYKIAENKSGDRQKQDARRVPNRGGRGGTHSTAFTDSRQQRLTNQPQDYAYPASNKSIRASSSSSYAQQNASKAVQGKNQFTGNETGENKSGVKQKQDVRRSPNRAGRDCSQSTVITNARQLRPSIQNWANACPVSNESIRTSSSSSYAPQGASMDIQEKTQFIGNKAAENSSDVRQKQDVRRLSNRAGRGGSHSTVITDPHQQRRSNQPWANAHPALNDSIQESSSSSYATQGASKDTQGKNEIVRYEICENKSLDRQKQDARRASNRVERGGSQATVFIDARQQGPKQPRDDAHLAAKSSQVKNSCSNAPQQAKRKENSAGNKIQDESIVDQKQKADLVPSESQQGGKSRRRRLRKSKAQRAKQANQSRGELINISTHNVDESVLDGPTRSFTSSQNKDHPAEKQELAEKSQNLSKNSPFIPKMSHAEARQHIAQIEAEVYDAGDSSFDRTNYENQNQTLPVDFDQSREVFNRNPLDDEPSALDETRRNCSVSFAKLPTPRKRSEMFAIQMNRSLGWKNTTDLSNLVVDDDGRVLEYVGFYLAHRGFNNPMPDIVVDDGKCYFCIPETDELMNMSPRLLFNLFPIQNFNPGHVIAGRYKYIKQCNKGRMGQFLKENIPNGFVKDFYTQSNFPAHLHSLLDLPDQPQFHKDWIKNKLNGTNVTPDPVKGKEEAENGYCWRNYSLRDESVFEGNAPEDVKAETSEKKSDAVENVIAHAIPNSMPTIENKKKEIVKRPLLLPKQVKAGRPEFARPPKFIGPRNAFSPECAAADKLAKLAKLSNPDTCKTPAGKELGAKFSPRSTSTPRKNIISKGQQEEIAAAKQANELAEVHRHSKPIQQTPRSRQNGYREPKMLDWDIDSTHNLPSTSTQ